MTDTFTAQSMINQQHKNLCVCCRTQKQDNCMKQTYVCDKTRKKENLSPPFFPCHMLCVWMCVFLFNVSKSFISFYSTVFCCPIVCCFPNSSLCTASWTFISSDFRMTFLCFFVMYKTKTLPFSWQQTVLWIHETSFFIFYVVFWWILIWYADGNVGKMFRHA